MKYKIVIALLLVTVGMFSKELPNIVAPSPEARKMIEYGDKVGLKWSLTNGGGRI